MRRGRLPGRGTPLAIGALVLVTALALSACGQGGGQGLAQQACVHVHRSVQDYEQSTRAGTAPATIAALRTEADQELRKALPLAAAANSDDGSWNSLMTTISESNTVDESHLIPALRAQCDVADTEVNVNPQGPPG